MAAVTLQLGSYAGFVGAHWWQLQARGEAGAELRADALHRAGRAPDPYAPRLVLLDLRGSLGSLRRDGGSSRDAGNDGAAAWSVRGAGRSTAISKNILSSYFPLKSFLKTTPGTHWEGGHSRECRVWIRLFVTKAEGKPPLASLQSCECGQVWSDYLRVHLHPRSIFEIQRYNHDGDSNRLEAFGQGESLLSEPTYLDELEDKLHFFIEECDYLQGFQILCDMHDGFSGVGAKVTELLCDEYSGRGILSWGLTPIISNTGDPHKDFYRLMNTVLGIVHLSRHSSLFCPLSLNGSLGLRPQAPITLPYIHYDASLNYHSSAILAAALETMTVPYRLHTSQLSMMQLAEALNFSGRKVVAAGAAVPFSVSHGHSLPDALCSYQHAVPWKPLSSCGEQKDSFCFAQSVVLRGIGKENHISNFPTGTQPSSALHVYETGEEVLGNYLNMLSPGTLSISHLLQSPCKVQSPYPQFFSPLLNKQGFLLDKPRSHSAVVESIPVLTALQSSPVLHTALYNLYKELQKVDVRRWASFFAAGIELDDFQEALLELRTLSQCYKKNSEPDESEDEADSD
uniref:Protein misato homolog 1 n=1 Tax=Crocodylus porosus TaxID=8502 RepID=A0A7M4E6S6_CROPO